MRKIFIWMCIGVLTCILSGCSNKKSVDFDLISQDIPMMNYQNGSFEIINDMESFVNYFPNYLEEKDLNQINAEVFINHSLIYFEFTSNYGVLRDDLNLKSIKKESNRIFFEVFQSGVVADVMRFETLYYLVSLKKKDISEQDHFYIENLIKEKNVLLETNIGFEIISDTKKANKYDENTFLIIDDFNAFQEHFPKEGINKIKEETFIDYCLIYFEYVPKVATDKAFEIKKISIKEQNMHFEIFSSVIDGLQEDKDTYYFLVKVHRNSLTTVENYVTQYNGTIK